MVMKSVAGFRTMEIPHGSYMSDNRWDEVTMRSSFQYTYHSEVR